MWVETSDVWFKNEIKGDLRLIFLLFFLVILIFWNIITFLNKINRCLEAEIILILHLEASLARKTNFFCHSLFVLDHSTSMAKLYAARFTVVYTIKLWEFHKSLWTEIFHAFLNFLTVVRCRCSIRVIWWWELLHFSCVFVVRYLYQRISVDA